MFEDGDGDWERHHDIAPAPELSDLAELPDWKLDEPVDAEVKRWDDKNPFASTDVSSQKESADQLL